jgi:hypothetical protein
MGDPINYEYILHKPLTRSCQLSAPHFKATGVKLSACRSPSCPQNTRSDLPMGPLLENGTTYNTGMGIVRIGKCETKQQEIKNHIKRDESIRLLTNQSEIYSLPSLIDAPNSLGMLFIQKSLFPPFPRIYASEQQKSKCSALKVHAKKSNFGGKYRQARGSGLTTQHVRQIRQVSDDGCDDPILLYLLPCLAIAARDRCRTCALEGDRFGAWFMNMCEGGLGRRSGFRFRWGSRGFEDGEVC